MWSKVYVCSRLSAEIMGLNGCLSVVSVMCCQVEVSDELITHPEESYQLWCVIMCDVETSRMRKPWPVSGGSATGRETHTQTHRVEFKYNVIEGTE